MNLEKTEVRDDCADEGQQQFNRLTVPILTEDLYSIKGRISNKMLYVQYIHLSGQAYS
jgi:hypothetical protein